MNDETIGWPTRALHWATAGAVIGALPLGLWIARAEPSLSTLWLFGLHKTLGISVLALTLLRLGWRRVSPPPPPLPSTPLRDMAARAVHGAFYVLLLAMPLLGWIGSSATGIDTVVFGRWTLPRIAPVSPAWEEAAFTAHGVLGWVLILMIALHVAGALERRDGTLRRMIFGRRRP